MHLEQVRRLPYREGEHYEVVESGCWNWTRNLTKAGYPMSYAWRRMWEAINGPRPDGYDMHHACHNRLCINPTHIEALEPREHKTPHWLARARRGTPLTLEDYQRMREMATDLTLRLEDIAAEFDVPVRTVTNVVNGHRWKEELGGTRVVVVRTCGFHLCGAEIAEGNRSRRYCNATCRVRANRAKTYTPNPERWTA